MRIKSTRLKNTTKLIIKEFNNNKTHYAIARNYEQYPNFDHDIDFFSSESVSKLKKILIKVAKKNNWDFLVYDDHFKGSIDKTNSIDAFRFYKCKFGKYEVLHLDFFRSSVIWGLPFIKSSNIQRQRNKTKKFIHLNLNLENTLRLMAINAHLSNVYKFQAQHIKKKINLYKKKVIDFSKKNKSFNTIAKNYGVFFAKEAIKFLKNNKLKKFKFYINASKLLFFFKYFFLHPISFFYHMCSRIIDYLNYYFFRQSGVIMNFYVKGQKQQKNIHKALNLLKERNFIDYWQVKKSKFMLSFQERKVLERRGIIVFFSPQQENNSITIKNKYNLNKILEIIMEKLIKKNLIIYKKINNRRN